MLPRLIQPMLATAGELPPPAEDARWSFELKWDGVRAIAYVEGGSVRLMSRNDLDVSDGYPEALGLARQLGPTAAVLDGELVTFDERGRPSFGRLQERMHVRDPNTVRRLAETIPVVYLVFDVLQLDGSSMLEVPYADRRRLLDGLELDGPGWRTPAAYPGAETGGAELLAASRESGLEGVVAKRLDSRYRPGRRSPDWVKVKHVRMQEVVVAGWRPGRGRREGMIGALIMGVHDETGELRMAGGVGTGFTGRSLADLAARLEPLARATSPFREQLSRADARDAHWVAPDLVGEVSYTEWTSDFRIRHPSWRGLRPDKRPEDVVRGDS